MNRLLVLFNDLPLAVAKFIWGPEMLKHAPPTSKRRGHLSRALPAGNGGLARTFRVAVLALDDMKESNRHIRSLPIAVGMVALCGPAILANEIIIWLIGGSPIVSAPASKALALIKFLVPTKAFERIFAQAIEDFREEYYLELAEGRVRRARWLHFYLYLTLIATTALWVGTSTAKKVVALWKAT